jgi:thymidylate kinase
MRLLDCLVEALNGEGIVYCHWKSSFYLREAQAKGRDFDLLVARKDARRFESTLAGLNVKRVVDPLQGPFPSVFHFYGLDDETNELVHLHVSYQVLTGESLLKNYRLPLEEPLLQNPRLIEGLPVPQAPAELLLFVIRTMAKQTSLIDYLLFLRRQRSGYETFREEFEALLAEGSAARSTELIAGWLPSVEPALFNECIDALRTWAPFPRRLWLAIRLRGQLKMFERFSTLSALYLRAALVVKRISHRLGGRRKSKQFASGGIVIAFVGPEATGKSTLVKETAEWLGQSFDVITSHLGKPPSTWLTLLPNLVLPLFRQAAPEYRTSRVEDNPGVPHSGSVSLLYALRSVMVAWDRRALAFKLRRTAANGSIVICDRYPSCVVGAMDSARLSAPRDKGWWGRLLGYLASMEHDIYRQIPPPDVVMRLTVPIEVALDRNREREKKSKEGDSYVLRRHTMNAVPSFPTARTIELDSNQPLSQTISSARHIVWDAL